MDGDVLNQLALLGQKATTNVGKTLTVGAGTAGAGTVDVTGSFNQADLNNNFATVVAQLNALRVVMVAAGLMT